MVTSASDEAASLVSAEEGALLCVAGSLDVEVSVVRLGALVGLGLEVGLLVAEGATGDEVFEDGVEVTEGLLDGEVSVVNTAVVVVFDELGSGLTPGPPSFSPQATRHVPASSSPNMARETKRPTANAGLNSATGDTFMAHCNAAWAVFPSKGQLERRGRCALSRSGSRTLAATRLGARNFTTYLEPFPVLCKS